LSINLENLAQGDEFKSGFDMFNLF